MATKIPRGHRLTPLNHEPEALQYAISKAGVTQKWLIDALAQRGHKVSKGQMSDIVKGDRNCQQPVLVAIAGLLNCPVVVLERKRVA